MRRTLGRDPQDLSALGGSERLAVGEAARVSPALEISPPEKRVNLSAYVSDPRNYVPLPGADLLIVQKAEGEEEIRQYNLVLDFDGQLKTALAKSLRGAR